VDEAYLANGVDAETVAHIGAAIEVFAALGATLVPMKVPDRQAAVDAQLAITDTESFSFHKPVYEADPSKFGPQLAAAMERGRSHDALTMSRAYIARDRFKGELLRAFEGIDAIASPVYPMVGARYDEMDRHLADLRGFLGFTSPFNVSGSPSITFPVGIAKVGMPIGMQLIGPHLTEPGLLKAAHAFQQATDWHLKRPPLIN
jgi:amidase